MQYRVLPITKQNITQGFETLTNPQNMAASPFGWHSDGVNNSTDTSCALLFPHSGLDWPPDEGFHFHSGNNVITFVGAPQFTTTQSSATLNFNYVQDPTRDPDALQANIDAARVNTFYIVNTVHDISYLYCFNEAAFNFQNNNFGKGGAGNDPVQVSVQDASGKNNGESPGP